MGAALPENSEPGSCSQGGARVLECTCSLWTRLQFGRVLILCAAGKTLASKFDKVNIEIAWGRHLLAIAMRRRSLLFVE